MKYLFAKYTDLLRCDSILVRVIALGGEWNKMKVFAFLVKTSKNLLFYSVAFNSNFTKVLLFFIQIIIHHVLMDKTLFVINPIRKNILV